MSDHREHQGDARHRDRSGGDHVEDLVEGYALGALDPLEREYVERHRRGCPDCDRELVKAGRTVGFLAFDVRPARPSPDVKIALMARVGQAQRAAVLAETTTERALRLPPTLTIPASRPTARPAAIEAPPVFVPAPLADPSPRSRRRLGWATPLVAVPLLLALALGTWSIQLRAELDERGAEVDELQSQARSATLYGAGVDVGRTYPLSPGSAAPLAEGRVVTDDAQGEATLMVDLNEAQAQRSLPVLVLENDTLVLAGEIEVDEQGQGETKLELERPFDQYERVYVKAQPLATGEADSDSADILSGDIGGPIGSDEENPEP